MSAILITGGAGNLGKTVVDTLYDAGHSLHLTVMSENDITHAKGAKYAVDLTSGEAVEKTIQEVLSREKKSGNYRIEAAVFLAGGYTAGGLDKVNMDEINKMIKLNFETSFHASTSLINHFKNSGGGKLIFTGAKAAMNILTAAGNIAYALSKQMLYNFCSMINESGKNNNISAHILLPNTLDTELNRTSMPDADFSQWTKPASIGLAIKNIIEGKETNTVISF
jgi:NAD(P)-dependent dehydrogenase (short-subunit alcohol dehydrogenase family)